MSETVDSVSAAEVIRNFGYWQQQALQRPLTVTHHGRARTMLISTDAYEALVRRAEGGNAPAHDFSQSLLDGMAEGFILVDSDIRFLDLNVVAATFFGAPRDQMIGRTMADALNVETNPMFEAMQRRVFRTGELLTYEINSKAFPGRVVSARSFPFRGQVATLLWDVTERERLEQGAREWDAAQMALALLDDAGLACLNLNGRVSFADASFQRLTGIGVDDVTGVRLSDLVTPGEQADFRAAFAEVTSGQGSRNRTLGLTTSSGDERHVRLTMSPIERGSAITGVMIVLAPARPGAAAHQTAGSGVGA